MKNGEILQKELDLITRYQIKIDGNIIILDELSNTIRQKVSIGEKVNVAFNKSDVKILG